MTIAIDPLTFVISIPKADLTLIQLTPTEIRQLNLDDFRLALKDWEDDEGITMLKTHDHNPEVTVSGVTLARVINILDPYTVTFEDGQYAVNLVGANSNVADKVNVNQVSVRANNSAGLVTTSEIQHAIFDNKVTIDVDNGVSGTIYPTGTPLRPVNNLADALLIAEYRGFDTLFLLSDLTVETGSDISEYTLKSSNFVEVTIETGVTQVNTNYEKVSLYGEMGAYWNILIDCWVYDITEFSGWMRGGSFESMALSEYTAFGEDYGGLNYFDDVVPMYPGVTATLIGNTDVQVSFTNCSETVTLKSFTAGTIMYCGLNSGTLTIDATCAGGTFVVSGVGDITNNSTSVEPDISGLVSGKETQRSSFNDEIAIDVINGIDSAVYPNGAVGYPCKTLANVLDIFANRGFKKVHIHGDLTISGIIDGALVNFEFLGEGQKSTTLTVADDQLINCRIRNVTLTGSFEDGSNIEVFDSLIDDVSNITLDAHNCSLKGTIELNNTESSNLYNCTNSVAGSGTPIIEVNDCESLGIWNYSGGIKLTNITTIGTSVSFNSPAGRLVVDSTDTQGTIIARGIGSVGGTTGGTTISSDGLLDIPSIAGGIWDEEKSMHTDPSTFGDLQNNEISFDGYLTVNVDPDEIANAVWNTETSGFVDESTFGGMIASGIVPEEDPDPPTNTNVTLDRGKFSNVSASGAGPGSILFAAPVKKLIISVFKQPIAISLDNGINFITISVGTNVLSIGFVTKLKISGTGTWCIVGSYD